MTRSLAALMLLLGTLLSPTGATAQSARMAKLASGGVDGILRVGGSALDAQARELQQGIAVSTTEVASEVRSWLSPDPDWHKQGPIGLNVYQYAFWNPVKFVDPDGRAAVMVYAKDSRPAPFGHLGMVIVDDKTGQAVYTGFGSGVKDGNVSAATMHARAEFKDGKITQESYRGLLVEASERFNEGSDIEAVYVQAPDAKAMDQKAAELELKALQGEYKYDLLNNNCAHYCAEVAEAGGARVPPATKKSGLHPSGLARPRAHVAAWARSEGNISRLTTNGNERVLEIEQNSENPAIVEEPK